MLSTNLIYFIKLINNQWKLSGLDIINKTRYEDVNSASVNLDIYKGNVIEFDIIQILIIHLLLLKVIQIQVEIILIIIH